MKLNINAILVVTAMVGLTSCVSTKKFNALQSGYNSLMARNSELTREGESCKSNLDKATITISSLQDQINAERQHVKSLQSALDKCLTTAGQGNVNV